MPWDSRVDETEGLVRTPEIFDFWGRLQAREDVNLGHYGEDEKPHLKAVQKRLDEPGVHPCLMDDVFDFTEDWTAKFKLLLSYANTIVGVYEHSHGGHCWEAGFIDQYRYRTRTQAFYRTYEDSDEQYDAYNGMFWTHMLSLKNSGRSRP